MAKKQISNYKFVPGVIPPAYGEFPHTVDLLKANEDFLVAEINAYIVQQIAANASNNSSPYYGYNYTTTRSDKCKRDIRYVIDAIIYDLEYGGNALSYQIASRYYAGGILQVINPAIEIDVQTWLRSTITTKILTNTPYTAYNNTLTQSVLSYNGESTGITRSTTLMNIFIGVVTTGLSTLPALVVPDSQNGTLLPNTVALIEANKRFIQEEAIAFIAYNVANNVPPFVYFSYNSEKCKRDISYILEGYITDLRHGSNRITISNASKYFENGVPQVDGDRTPETATHTFIKNLIQNYILTNTAFTNRQVVVSQVINNALVTETAGDTRISELSGIVIDVITNGLTYLPAVISNRGYIKIPGFYKLKDFLLITNATRNTVLYNFADSDFAGDLTYSENYDSDFPGALYGQEKITTLVLDADTRSMMVTDSIQIFVEGKYQEVRLNDAGRDAMERQKVGIPQSMLDADFEYGLQPTKWQALALLRNYPSIFEIPNSDIPVATVTTDASSGTSGIGASQLTVTTISAHGLSVGSPITIKALANSVSGFSRAEGSFLIASVPSATSLTYFAKSKVGTSNGQQLSSTYTQLRRGGFYTGASISNPTFNVYSAGSSGTITTSLITPSGTTNIGFTGTVPPLGAPVSGTGITSGSQITAVTGPGGTAASTALSVNAPIGANSVVVPVTTGISAGLIFDRGDGQAIIVTDVSGNTVSFNAALTSAIIGINETYSNLTQTSTNGSGSGAVFSITRNASAYTAYATSPGTGYVASNTITIAGTSIGGTAPTNSATLTITAASDRNTVATFNDASLTSGYGYSSNSHTTTGGTGTGLTVTVTIDPLTFNSLLTVAVDASGSGYTVGDLITIVGDAPEGSVLELNTISLTPGTGYASNLGVATSVTPFGGSGLTVNYTDNGSGGIATVTINNSGSGYSIGDTLTILDGNSDATIDVSQVSANGTILVATVNAGGLIQSLTTAGTPITAPTKNFISAITLSDVTTAQIATGNTGISYSAIATIELNFPSPHGFVPGDTVTVNITSADTGAQLAAGPYFVEQVPTTTSIRYTARTPGAIANTLTGVIYARPDSFFVHRPFDGGVQLGTGGPAHGASAIRMSKKYIRYQSGKGVMYNTGALFAPSYDLRSLSANSTAVNSVITVATDDTDHGCQVGAQVVISGVQTSGYNGVYTVVSVIDERTYTVLSQQVLGATSAILSDPCQMSVRSWHGATVRAGIFDDQNGMFWQYDGQRMAVVRRSSTFQVAGTISINANSNSVTGNNTRFTQQLAAGERIVIRGMSHVVSSVISNTSLTVTPDYRGVSNVVDAKCCKTIDIIIPQENWNLDTCNGAGPSGYNLDVTKMQMIGIQHTWYGAGFIDFMLRGPEGNYIWCHRFRNSNVNTEAYMRSGNQPVRYEVINEGAKDKLAAAIDSSVTTIPLSNAYWFPPAGTVLIDSELVRYNGNDGTNLLGCTRASAMSQFVSGSSRTFTGSTAAGHIAGAGVVLVDNTVTPIISHWGSAFMIDGQFDSDRGYIFNYASTGIGVSVDKQTAFLIRLAPSVSNAQTGDLGDKELLNRAQMLLSSIACVSDSVTGGGGIVVEGVLNPGNYPDDPTKITWTGLNSQAAGGQPSFAQIASGGSVSWGGNLTTQTATVQGAFTTTLTAKSFAPATASLTATSFSAVTQTATATSFAAGTSATYTTAINAGRSDFLIPQSQLTALNLQTPLTAGDIVSVAGNAGTLSSVVITTTTVTASYSTTTMTVTAGSGLVVGMSLAGTGITPGTYIAALGTGTGGTGTYILSQAATTGTNISTVSTIFTCSSVASLLAVGETVTIAGTAGGTGSIGGYSNPKTYYIIATNSTTNFQLSATYGGPALSLTGGTPTGLSYTVSTFISSGQLISGITANYITLASVSYARIQLSAVPTLTSGTATSNGQYNVTVTFTSSVAARYTNAISTGRTDFLIPQSQFASTTASVTDVLSVSTYLTGNQTISGFTANYTTIAGTAYARVVMSSTGTATSTAGSGNNSSVTATSAATATYGSALSTARTDFLITDAAYLASGIALGDVLSLSTYLTGSQTILSISQGYISIGGTSYTRILMSAVANSTSTSGSGNDQTVTVTAAGSAATYVKTNYLFFTSSTFIASGATIGTRVASDQTAFPAGSSVAAIATRTFGATTVYRVTFTQTSNTTINAAGTLKFQFGAAYALPGEQVFSFVSNPGGTDSLSLETLKELTSTAIGGRGTFPNGPDVLAINVYKVSGTATTANLILRWGEAQA